MSMMIFGWVGTPSGNSWFWRTAALPAGVGIAESTQTADGGFGPRPVDVAGQGSALWDLAIVFSPFA